MVRTQPGPDGFNYQGHLTTLFDDCGYWASELNDAKLTPKLAVHRVWTGTKVGGTYNATTGACADWSSQAHDVTGSVGRTFSAGDSFFDDGAGDRCTSSAFLFCVSE